jgi:hypothetical protein
LAAAAAAIRTTPTTGSNERPARRGAVWWPRDCSTIVRADAISRSSMQDCNENDAPSPKKEHNCHRHLYRIQLKKRGCCVSM